jgi:oligosaccharide repeat unit polymerase
VAIFEIGSRKYQNPKDIFYPKYLLLLLFFLYSLAGILFAVHNGTDSQGITIPSPIINEYIVTCLIGLVGLCLGFRIASSRNPFKHKKVSIGFNDRTVQQLLIFFIFLALAVNFVAIVKRFDFLNVKSYADFALLYRIDRRESDASGLYEVFLVDSPVLLINFFCILLFLKNRRKGLIRYLYLIPFICSALTATFSGFRSSLIDIVIPFFFLYHYYFKHFVLTRRKILFYGIVGALVYVFINLLSLLRSSSDPIEMFHIAVTQIGSNGVGLFSLDKSGELITSLNLMRLMSGLKEGLTQFTYGKSFIDDILVFVPHYFYPGRPNSVSEQFVITFYPYIYKSGGGMGQFCLLEGFWSFGNIGVFMTSFIYSFSLIRFYQRFSPYLVLSPVFILIYSLVFDKSVLSVIRGGYIGAVKACLISTTVILIAIFISKHLRTPQRIQKNVLTFSDRESYTRTEN